jgi:hypothetical protein
MGMQEYMYEPLVIHGFSLGLGPDKMQLIPGQILKSEQGYVFHVHPFREVLE